MSDIAGPIDGWKLLQALGISADRKVKRAAIVIEPGCCVMLNVTEYVQPFNVIGDEIETLMTQYEFRKVEKHESVEAGGINNSGMYERFDGSGVQ